MTCIAGCVDEKGVVYMGGDSAVSGKDLVDIRADSKVWKHGAFLMGCAGNPRMRQLLTHSFHPPVYDQKTMSIEKYMSTVFIQSARHCFRKARYDDEELGGCALVGFQGRLFQIDGNYQVMEVVRRYDAIGSGAAVALGAMFVTTDLAPYERIQRALEAAAFHIQSVRAPFCIEKLEPCLSLPKTSKLQQFKQKMKLGVDAWIAERISEE